MRCPIVGDKNLIPVGRSVDRQGAIQKAGFVLGKRAMRRRQKQNEQRRQSSTKTPQDNPPQVQLYHVSFDARMGRTECSVRYVLGREGADRGAPIVVA